MPRGSLRRVRSQTPAALAAYLAVCGAGAGSLLAGCGGEADAAEPAPEAAAVDAAPELPEDYDPRRSLAPMIKAVGPSVVAVYTQGRGGGTRGGGSGFVLSEDGLVITNHHVVENADGVQVRLSDGQRFSADVLGSDEATDLALLRLRDASELPVAKLGSSAALEVGDWVVAIGNPMGLEHSASVGIVSGKGRGSLGLYRDSYLDFLQTDADIAPGSSGGPLFDFEGNVVGINTAVGAGSRPGFAIPIDTARRVVAQLEKHGRVARGWLGAASVPGDDRGRGAKLGQIYGGTPAHSAGLREGDLVTAVDGDAISSFTELRSRIATTEPGQKVALSVERDDKSIVVDVTLQERPEEQAMGRLRPAELDATPPPATREPAPQRKLPFGITLPGVDDDEPSSSGDPVRLGVRARAGDRGLEIVEVDAGSLAEQLGLQADDRITEINGESVRDGGDVSSALAKDERKVTVRFDRKGAPHRVTLERH